MYDFQAGDMEGYKWDMLLRFQLIEVIAYWEGRVSATHLMNSFNIARQQASQIIKQYMHEIAPNNLEYDAHLKGFKPTLSFEPKVSSGMADEYLHLISQKKDMAHIFTSLDLNFAHTEIISPVRRYISPIILRSIVNAVRLGERIDIGYVSVNNPDIEGRIIAPHSLVCTDNRWHVRAFCEKNQDYRDFVLSRFRGVPELMGESTNVKERDSAWAEEIELLISPDQRLDVAQQEVIAHDYGMDDKILRVSCRAALLQYVLQAYRISPHKHEAKPEAQQIVITNYMEIEKWL